MEAWMAFVSIIAIVAIILVAGGLVAFIGHMIIGVFDNDKRQTTTKQEVVDYEIKQLESPKMEKVEEIEKDSDYDFEAINEAKAEEERKILEAKEMDDIDLFKLESLELNASEDLESLEARLKAQGELSSNDEEEVDDLDLDSLLDEIANDVIEEEKVIAEEAQPVEMDSELQNYSIEDYLKEKDEEEMVQAISEEFEEPVKEEDLEELFKPVEEIQEIDEVDDSEDEGDEVKVDLTEEVETEEVAEEIEQISEDEKEKEIKMLKEQLAELNKKLEEARTSKVEIVSIDMTEEEAVSRLEVLEERLRNAKKEYKINMKEYKPLKKVMNDLEKYQTKLRRKETIVAKKKVALYGVNNYVDIDKEKAEKLANELELLDGLRLSVNHCEEVINANKDRYPILENTNRILEDQIAHLEADIATTTAMLQKIQEKKDKE